MKHLFYIHSAITYFIALEVIKINRLNKSDCKLLLGIGFEPSQPVAELAQIALPFSHFPVNSFAVKRLFWNSWKKLWAFDDFVKNLIQGEPFHLYTNQTGIEFIGLFMSHKNCDSFSYLEEGLYSYYSAEEMNYEICPSGYATPYYKLLRWVNFFGRLPLEPRFFAEGYKAVYGISDNSFPGFKNKVILANPFFNADEVNWVSGHIIALDALYEYGLVEKANYERAINDMFSYFDQQKIDQVWIKFHPEQYANTDYLIEIRSIVSGFKGDVVVNELSKDCSLEMIAGNKLCDATFYVFLSSVGLYAGLCGRKVYSFANFISEQDENYKRRIDTLPDAFSKYVEFL